MTQGIYEIYCIRNKKRYIGSSKDIERRWNDHTVSLESGTHHNRYLQKAWETYGESEFVFTILEEVKNSKQLFKQEEFYIKKFKFHTLFNIMRKPGAVPRKTSSWAKNCQQRKKKELENEFAWGVD